MRTRAARVQLSPTEPAMLMAMELSASIWKLVFANRLTGQRRRIGVRAWDQERVRAEISKARERLGLSAGERVICCQEAGRDGFSVHRFVESLGIESLVIDAGSMEVSRKRRRAKTDRLDAEKLMDHLCRYIGGEQRVWRVLHVPSEQAEDRRRLNRTMEVLRRERKRLRCQIHSKLATVGVRCRLTKSSSEEIDRLRQWNGEPLPPMLLLTLRTQWRCLQQIESLLEELEGERRRLLQTGDGEDLAKIRLLQQLGAIGDEGSWLLVLECFGYRRFDNERQVGASAGLTPTPYASGASHSEQGIGKDGNKRVRWMMIQLAWGWLRRQPQSKLSQWYQSRFGKAGDRPRRIGIVALARKLLVALWRYLEHGIVPEGAVLKRA